MASVSKWWEGSPLILAPLVGGSDLAFRLLARTYGAQVTFTEMTVVKHYLRDIEIEHARKNNTPLKGEGRRSITKHHPLEFALARPHAYATAHHSSHTFPFSSAYDGSTPVCPKCGRGSSATALHKYCDFCDRPLVLQVASRDADEVIRMAKRPELVGHIDGIDLNCGCPQGFAIRKKIGAGLLEDSNGQHLIDMCRRIVEAGISYPLSVKMRLVVDVPTTIELIRKLHNVGVQCFTVHARYRNQRGIYRGKADWLALKEITTALPHVPVIGNGDIITFDQFESMRRETGVVATMAGYGALLSPAVFHPSTAMRVSTGSSSIEDISLSSVVSQYLSLARQCNNRLVDVQRHLAWMMKRHTDGDIKRKLFSLFSYDEVAAFLEENMKLKLDVDNTSDNRIEQPSRKKMESIKRKKLMQQEKKSSKRQRSVTTESNNVQEGNGVGGW